MRLFVQLRDVIYLPRDPLLGLPSTFMVRVDKELFSIHLEFLSATEILGDGNVRNESACERTMPPVICRHKNLADKQLSVLIFKFTYGFLPYVRLDFINLVVQFTPLFD